MQLCPIATYLLKVFGLLQNTLISRMEALISHFDRDLADAVDERREHAVRLKYAELRMIEHYEELQVRGVVVGFHRSELDFSVFMQQSGMYCMSVHLMQLKCIIH